MSVICGAKNKYNQLYGTNYRLEDLENKIGEALIRVNRKHKKTTKRLPKYIIIYLQVSKAYLLKDTKKIIKEVLLQTVLK